MKRRSLSWLLLWVALVLSIGAARDASAEPNDDAAQSLVSRALKARDLETKGGAAKALIKLELAKKMCDGSGCSAVVRAKVQIALGTVLVLAKKEDQAKAAFVLALKDDPSAALLPDRSSAEVKSAFDAAKASLAAPPPKPEPAAPAPPAGGPGDTCKDDSGQAPKGWKSSVAFCFFTEAVAAEASQEWGTCAGHAQSSLTAEDRPTTRYLAAQCQERAGRWTGALRDYQMVIDAAREAGLKATAQEAQIRAKLLRERVPRLVIRPPARAENLVVTLDGTEVAADKLGGEIWVNPGQRVVKATGKIAGASLRYEQTITIRESERKEVEITAGGGQGAPLQDAETAKCVAEAKTREQAQACFEAKDRSIGPTIKVGAELSGYHDSDDVDVLSPAVAVGIEDNTAGWGLNGSFLVDIVTAASADIVSTASPRWTEIRYVPALGGHKKFGDTDLRLGLGLSVEPDYLATSVTGGVSTDLAQKMVTPSLSYQFAYDISGRAGTPFDVFSKKIQRHSVDLSTTFVVDKATIFSATVTGVLEIGDTSKPYRYMPVFAPDVVVLAGETVESVNTKRLPERIAEQLPTDRKRLGGAALIAHRFEESTLRLEERAYIDSWGLKATTTDMKLYFDVSRGLRLWPHLRFHAQTAVDFWETAYVAKRTSVGLEIPLLRAGDRELGPLLTGTAGAGARVDLGENGWGLIVSADAMYTRFLDHLFIRGRFGVFGAAALEVEIE